MMMTRSNAMIIASPIVIGIAVIIDGLQVLRMGLTKTCPAPELKGGVFSLDPPGCRCLPGAFYL